MICEWSFYDAAGGKLLHFWLPKCRRVLIMQLCRKGEFLWFKTSITVMGTRTNLVLNTYYPVLGILLADPNSLS